MKTKLTTKDLITAGAFGAIYLVLLTVLSSVLTIVPIPLSGNAVDCRHHPGNCVYAVCHQGAAHRCDPGAGDPGGADYVHDNHLSADFCSCMGINR